MEQGQLHDLLDREYGIKGEITFLYGEIDTNYYVRGNSGTEYLLKLSPSDTDKAYLDMQVSIMDYLSQFEYDFELSSLTRTRAGVSFSEVEINDGSYLFRLQNWIPYQLMADCSPVTGKTLQSIGYGLGCLTHNLQNYRSDFQNSQIKWAPTHLEVEDVDITLFPNEVQDSVLQFTQDFKVISPRIQELRQSWIYHDANDHNILLRWSNNGNYELGGLIDFGDAIHSHTINDLAVAIAYCSMGRQDVLQAASQIVKGYCRSFPLQDDELEVLYYLVAARLIISLRIAGENLRKDKENEYLQISVKPATDLLLKWSELHPDLVHYHFRTAAAKDPIPHRTRIQHWLASAEPAPLMETGDRKFRKIDLSVGSSFFGIADNYIDDQTFFQLFSDQLDFDNEIGYGGYLERRPFYTTDSYTTFLEDGPEWRTVHLGMDLWAPAGTIIRAPFDGEVHSYNNNEGRRNYGPTIILKHLTAEGDEFFSLYGHLAEASLAGLVKNQKIIKGQELCAIGNSDENGGWPPHLHFQIILDLLDHMGDFPGVCRESQLDVWQSICPDPAVCFPEWTSSTKDAEDNLLDRRKRHLPPNLSISYREPLQMLRGHRQFLLDKTGRRYLDTVNNVAHVGHEHPRVVAAGQKQMAILNTNTRYLHPGVVELAEKLSAKFPSPLEVCFFVNSGSEATELALRLSRTYTGNSGMVVMDVGYHGNTNGAVSVSSYKFDRKGGRGPEDHIRKVPLPDAYRGMYQGADCGHQYARHTAQAAGELKDSPCGLAGFICESILSCGGQIVLPEHFLSESAASIRKAGGLVISDEVQVGFGRVGEHYWGFELYPGVIPDIVTMGKPFGNGHPLGAVITTREIADAFANGMEYFNTFGGNPVSCAIGATVMDVVADENLQAHALKLGNYLMDRLRDLQKSYPVIGDVRGHGLFNGFELADDPINKLPSKAKADYLVSRMRTKGVLMSTDGFDENVIKIKPPMCITKEDVDMMLELLEGVLREDYMQI